MSWGNFLAHVASKVVLSADVVVVGVVLGAVNAGFYALASRLFAVTLGVASATNPFLLPAFAEAEGAGEVRRQRKLLLLALRAGTALALLVALPLVLLPDDLLAAWVGEGYRESAPLVAILGIVALIYQPVSIMTQYLVAVRRQRRVAAIFVPAAAVSVSLSVAAAQLSGLEAVAWTTLVVVGAVFVVLIRALRSPLALDYTTVARAIARPVAPTLVAGVVLLGGAGRYLDPDSLARLAPIGIAWLLVGAALVWTLGLSAEQRAVIRRVR